jgi:hypothetical protein
MLRRNVSWKLFPFRRLQETASSGASRQSRSGYDGSAAARAALGLAENVRPPRPYYLWHTFPSLRIAEGRTIVYVAAQTGHSPEECATAYLHLFVSTRTRVQASAQAPRTRFAQRVNRLRREWTGGA